jgi:hypothetical protein
LFRNNRIGIDIWTINTCDDSSQFFKFFHHNISPANV